MPPSVVPSRLILRIGPVASNRSGNSFTDRPPPCTVSKLVARMSAAICGIGPGSQFPGYRFAHPGYACHACCSSCPRSSRASASLGADRSKVVDGRTFVRRKTCSGADRRLMTSVRRRNNPRIKSGDGHDGYKPVSRAHRSTERSAVMRCRTGIATSSESATIPDQGCTTSLVGRA